MKRFSWIVAIAVILAVAALAAPPQRGVKPRSASELDTQTWIDANRILMFVTNIGSFASDLGGFLGKTDGLYYPFYGVDAILNGSADNTVVYASGIWLGAKDSTTGEILIAVAEYSQEFAPGPMIDGGPAPDQETNPLYRVFKIDQGVENFETGDDYAEWPVSLGAPADSLGAPALIGDQMLWAVYNDAQASEHNNDAGSTPPLGVEVQQTTIGFARAGALGDMVFLKFKIHNRGTRTLDSMFVSLWADPDLGDASDDLVGCDTLLSLGYCYNATNADGQYGSNPPAVGYDFFQGPMDSTGDPADTAFMWGQKWPGNRNLPMSSFNKYINGTDPQSFGQTYNYMKGLLPDGSPYLYNGQQKRFFHSGDPVVGAGDLDANPADRRFMLTTGPFKFHPGDSTEVVAGILVQQGGDRLQSVRLLKELDVIAQRTYDSNFVVVKPPANPIVTVTNQDGEVVLSWTDTSEVAPGDFPFEGYTVYQGRRVGSSIEYVEIPQQTYDVINGIKIILDSIPDAEAQQPLPKVQRTGNDRGVKRYFTTRTDYNTGEPLSNLTEYFYRVEAYSYNPEARAGDKVQPSRGTNVTAIPQGAPANFNESFVGNDIIPTEHIGNSDGTVSPIVMDPTLLTGHDYQVTFDTLPEFDTTITDVEDSTITIADSLVRGDTVLYFNRDSIVTHPETTITTVTIWTLRDLTADTVLADTMVNQSGDDEYPMFDGFLLKVEGPPPGLKGGEEGEEDQGFSVVSGSRRITQLGGDGFHMEGWRGTVGWGNHPDNPIFFGTSTVTAADIRNVEIRLASTDANGNFTAGDSNASFGYRYGRGFAGAPADSSWLPFMVNRSGGYSFQDFTESVPLAVYDTETDPPRRLAVGYLENNAGGGMVDGKHWPPFYGAANGDNTAGGGPREWLFIFDVDYSETADPALQVDVLNTPTPVMYMATWNRRDEDPWSEGGVDAFMLYANHILLPADTFTFTATPWSKSSAGGSARLDEIRAVPNPYYLFSSYDSSVRSRQIRFSNLPEVCTITIYSLTGDQVAKVEKNSPESWTFWDVETANGIPVASGIYIWVVDAPGIGQKIGKLAVFTETEQLPQY